MIFQIPELDPDDAAVLKLISEQREQLKYLVASTPRRWNGFLRKNTLARAMQGSNSILLDAGAFLQESPKSPKLISANIRACREQRF